MHHTNKDNHFARIIIQLQKKLYNKRYLILFLITAILLVTMFFGFFKMFFFLLIFSAANVFVSYIARHIPRAHTSVEIIMLSTVLVGYSYGPDIGGIFGAISALLYYYAIGRFSMYVIVFAPLYALCGALANMFSFANILTVGMWCTIVYYIISSVLVFAIFNARIYKMIEFAIVNIPLNFIMFKYIAPILLVLMK